jgi:hypothetical protein
VFNEPVFVFSQGGLYVFNLLETYVAGLSLLSTVFFEAVAVSWLYGLEHLINILIIDLVLTIDLGKLG